MWTATQQQLAKSSGQAASCAERAEARQGRTRWGGVGESRPDCDARGTGVGVRVTQEVTRHFLGDTGGTHLCTRDCNCAHTGLRVGREWACSGPRLEPADVPAAEN